LLLVKKGLKGDEKIKHVADGKEATDEDFTEGYDNDNPQKDDRLPSGAHWL